MARGSGFFAFLVGAGLGTALGILFAPDKGENTRKKLTYQLDSYREKLRKTIDELGKEELNIGKSEAKDRSAKVVSDAKNKAEKLLADVDQLINQIKTKES
ncbi:YtxH domain-containing protein [Hyphobacterium sp. CCMP332]|nr:YtxH domain-containing protein [Hyphobacterium sp. CCMP332]